MDNDQLAGKEMTIGRWYLRQGDTLAATNRFKTVVDRYQTTSHAPEALYRLVEAYLTIGLLDEAKRNGAVLGYNYPGDPWYGSAYKLLTSKGLRPAIEPKSGNGMFRLPFTKDKAKTVKPPVVAEVDAQAQPEVTETTKVATKAAADQAPPKRKGFRLPFSKKE